MGEVAEAHKKISVYVMEEHKEAYYFWHLMRSKGEIAAENNFLLHVDHHGDFQAGQYPFDPSELNITIEEAKRRSYEHLGIADFIIPAIFQGLFSENYFLCNFKEEIQVQELYIRKNDCWLELKLVTPVIKTFLRAMNNNRRAFLYHVGGLAPFAKEDARKLVLDVDLDYFCWDNSLSTAGPHRIEITKAQYQEIVGDTYNPLRLYAKPQYKFVEADGRYYLEFLPVVKPDKRPERKEILERMDKFFAWLRGQNIQPAAIDICRSRISGYLPRDVFPWIEEEFLARLEKLYEIEIVVRPGKVISET